MATLAVLVVGSGQDAARMTAIAELFRCIARMRKVSSEQVNRAGNWGSVIGGAIAIALALAGWIF